MTSDATITAYIALGSNLGDREGKLRAALQRLAGPEVEVVRCSRFLDNPAIGLPAGAGAFLNAAAEIRTTMDAHALLNRLLEIEHELGRVRRQERESRPIDLDLLLYGDQIIQTPTLAVPHPLMHKRWFVLKPLCEIAPQAIHPIMQTSIEQLMANLNGNAH